MRRHLLAFIIILCTSFTAQAQTTGEFKFSRVSNDTSLCATITIGYDYIKVVTTIKHGPLKGYKLPSTIYGSSPDYQFSLDDYGGFWISRSSRHLKMLARFNVEKRRYTYIRINGVEYRQ